jgi:3-deoxy-manno-octulosonate cytidylyltransferase (CMP-KDO synthetase)
MIRCSIAEGSDLVFRVVIPARFDSTRLPGKVLLPLAGRPMIQWVHERAGKSGAAEVIIATDDVRIAQAARGFGAQVAMTAQTHPSGSDRVAQVARERGWGDDDIVVNVQADEPLIPPLLIAQVAQLLAADRQAHLATLATPLAALEEFLDPNIVKVVTDAQGRALYFSRAPIPWDRDGACSGGPRQMSIAAAMRHIGIYAYRVAALKKLTLQPPSTLELCEKLEQLRALASGFRILVAQAREVPGPDVNTAEDLGRVAQLMGR